MISYLLLGMILLFIWMIAYWLFGKELLCPASLVPLVMMFGTFVALIGLGTWNSWELNSECILLISLAVASFVAGCFIPKWSMPSAKEWASPVDCLRTCDQVNVLKFAALFAIALIAIFSHVSETMRIATESGFSGQDYAAAAAWVRQSTSTLFSVNGGLVSGGFSFLDKQLAKLVTAIAYIGIAWSLIAVKNHDWQSFALALLLVFTKVAYVFLSGSRGGAFILILALILGAFVFTLRVKGRRMSGRLSMRVGMIAAALFVVCAAAFYAAGSVVGRTAGSAPIEYLSFYFGCGIPAFQRTLVEGAAQFDLIGFNTFHEQYYLLQKVGFVSQVPAYGNFWLNMGGHNCNVFTFVYRYYSDFGPVGVVVMPYFSGFVYTLLYERAFREKLHPASLAMYLYVGQALFDIERDAVLFSTLFTSSTLITLILTALVGAWFFMPREKRALICRPYSRARGKANAV